MSGTWTTTLNTRMDAESNIATVSQGTYNAGTKIAEAITIATSSTTQTGTLTVPIVTPASLQSFFFTCDQGTAANPVTVTFTLSTGTQVLHLVAGQPYYWDVNSGIANPFAYASTGTTASYSIPGALALTAASTVNITARIAQN